MQDLFLICSEIWDFKNRKILPILSRFRSSIVISLSIKQRGPALIDFSPDLDVALSLDRSILGIASQMNMTSDDHDATRKLKISEVGGSRCLKQSEVVSASVDQR
jgi:hypothetical protein